jgi:hypothetical protein
MFPANIWPLAMTARALLGCAALDTTNAYISFASATVKDQTSTTFSTCAIFYHNFVRLVSTFKVLETWEAIQISNPTQKISFFGQKYFFTF